MMFRAFLSVVVGYMVCEIVAADVPRLVHYQGRLRDAGGAAVTGSVSLRFRLYDAPTNPAALFDETQSSVSVSGGLFSVLIGANTGGGVPDSALNADEFYLGVSVDNGTELSPRSKVGSGPHAFKSRSAEQLVIPGTYAPVVTVGSGGQVGIGETSPTHALEVHAESGDIFQASGAATQGPPAYTWTQVNPSPGWSSRLYVGGLTFDGAIWAIGGSPGPGNSAVNDVWKSVNGASWTQVTSNAAWFNRAEHGVVASGGRMWVMAGTSDGSSPRSDVWYSTNGTNWTQAPASGHWGARWAPATVDFNGRLWIMGGYAPPNRQNDVWSSIDGVNWTAATTSAGWSTRSSFSCAVYDGRMWVMSGGTATNDVWSSTNGANWTQLTSAAPWAPKAGYAAFDLAGRLWMIGGDATNDVWSTTDGSLWSAHTSAPWSGRGYFGVAQHDGKAWIYGGTISGTRSNDVWSFAANSTESQPIIRLLASGNLGVGTSSPSHPLEMGSGAHVTAGGTWTDASSIQLKKDVADLTLEDAALAVRGLRPVTFAYKSDPSDPHAGFIAEEAPDLVATPDRRGLAPMDIVAVLTRVVQDQDDRLRCQEQVMIDLQATVERQEVELRRLRLAQEAGKTDRGHD